MFYQNVLETLEQTNIIKTFIVYYCTLLLEMTWLLRASRDVWAPALGPSVKKKKNNI